MTDYTLIRTKAGDDGPMAAGSTNSIPIRPTKEYSLTRFITMPVLGKDGRKVLGRYMQHPANITVVAFTAGEASARADEIQANTKIQAWGPGSRPWDSDGKVNWIEVEVPFDAKPLELK
jgi:hypothetical protein